LSPEITMQSEEARHFDGFASPRGLKGEAERCLISALRDRPNFTLLTASEVQQILGIAGSPSTIAGVRLKNGRELHASRVLLAAGALHSPRLMARYLTDTGLDAQLPITDQVGRNLKLHLLTALVAL